LSPERAAYRIRRARWAEDRELLRQVRETVFIQEQQVPLDLEWDDMDASAQHVLAEAGGMPIGTGRLLPDGRIGRMAVLPAWRNRGVGSALLDELLAMAEERALREVVLHAQTHARGFYERHGFQPRGREFLEAGIPHIEMVLKRAP
jgi:predicted GNAT family N-acyltransferase